MVEIIFFLAAVGLGSAVAFGGYFLVTRKASASVEAERTKIISEIETVLSDTKTLLEHRNAYNSKAQLERLTQMKQDLMNSLQAEKDGLKALESKLNTAQHSVEEKEAAHQELKTSREEDELKLEKILESYTEISGESITLEQQMASSMKNLDSLSSEIELTPIQQEMMKEMAEGLGQTSQQLRNLIIEYDAVNERLMLLKEQHNDLEDEYTKLVEQQLGA